MSASCEQNPFALLIGLAERLQQFFDDAASSVGLTAAQARVLMRLEAPTRMGDLAEAKTCDPSSITAMVRRLEREGLVARVVDPADARARLVQLTPQGARARTRLAEAVDHADDVIRQLPEQQKSALAALFAADTFAR
ncbi:MAG: MarR family transcriptional regulator [Actinomycetota bacterium]